MLFITTKDTKSTKVKTEDAKGRVFCSFFVSFVLFVVDRLFLFKFNELKMSYLEEHEEGTTNQVTVLLFFLYPQISHRNAGVYLLEPV